MEGTEGADRSCRNAGTTGIIEKIRKTVGDRPVYLSIDVRRFSF
jgi:hypothetical protein